MHMYADALANEMEAIALTRILHRELLYPYSTDFRVNISLFAYRHVIIACYA